MIVFYSVPSEAFLGSCGIPPRGWKGNTWEKRLEEEEKVKKMVRERERMEEAIRNVEEAVKKMAKESVKMKKVLKKAKKERSRMVEEREGRGDGESGHFCNEEDAGEEEGRRG